MPNSSGRWHPHGEINQVRFVEVLGHRIAYREAGRGIPIVFVHGFASSSYTWTYLVRELPEGYRCILLDLKGFGDSDKPSGNEYRLVDQASILEQVLEILGLYGVILVGHSYGGTVILRYLLSGIERQNDRIRGLVLIDTSGYSQKVPPLVSRVTIPLMSRIGLQLVPAEFLVRWSLREVFFDALKIPRDLIKEYARSLKSPGAKSALIKTAKLISTKERPVSPDQLSEILISTLIIWGENDTVVPLHNASKFAADLPNTSLKIIPKCGHAPQEECPTETARYIKEFLEELRA